MLVDNSACFPLYEKEAADVLLGCTLCFLLTLRVQFERDSRVCMPHQLLHDRFLFEVSTVASDHLKQYQ